MEPKYIHLREKNIVGLGAKFISILSPARNNMRVIPPLWEQLMSRMYTIEHRIGDGCYGLVEPLLDPAGASHPDEMFYIAAAEVSVTGDLPAGMISRVIPAGRYAVFTHQGKLDGLGETMSYIYKTWLAESKTVLQDAPHLEWYDQRFDSGSERSEFDIMLPIAGA